MIEAIRNGAVLLFMTLLAGCATTSLSSDPMARKIDSLVDATTQAKSEKQAFTEIESLGSDAVPYLVGHLGDVRRLPIGQISLTNHAANTFEGLRHYEPEVVHDALSALLNQITGVSFFFVYNGATDSVRKEDRDQWRDWCVKTYLEKAVACRGSR